MKEDSDKTKEGEKIGKERIVVVHLEELDESYQVNILSEMHRTMRPLSLPKGAEPCSCQGYSLERACCCTTHGTVGKTFGCKEAGGVCCCGLLTLAESQTSQPMIPGGLIEAAVQISYQGEGVAFA